MLPRTQYATSGKVSIVYQVTGDGPIDVIFASGWVSNVEYAWESPDSSKINTHVVEAANKYVYGTDDSQLQFVQERMGINPIPRIAARLREKHTSLSAA